MINGSNMCASIQALKILHGAGIHTVVSSTISKKNADNIIELYDILGDEYYIDEMEVTSGDKPKRI